jgi:hypothetical protein
LIMHRMKSSTGIFIRLIIVCFLAQSTLAVQAMTLQHADKNGCDTHHKMMTGMSSDTHNTMQYHTDTHQQNNTDSNTCHDMGCASLCQFACQGVTLLPFQKLVFQPIPAYQYLPRQEHSLTGYTFLLFRPPIIL